MPNPLTRLAVTTINGIGTRQGRSYAVQRRVLEPGDPAHLRAFGFDRLGAAWQTPSRGLHQVPPAGLQDFARFLLDQAAETALFVDNGQTASLYHQGHAYQYRSGRIPLSAPAVAFIQAEPQNSVRLLLRAFTRDALELPAGTVERMRARLRQGARDRALFRELRSDPVVRAYQQTRWDTRAPVAGDVLLGHNSIVAISRQERYALADGRILVDIVNPATRELHILDGSVVWMRIVDTTARHLVFAVIGSGRHRYPLMDAFNNSGAMGIWHCLALVQEHLYDDVPAACAEIPAHLARARRQSGPIAQTLYRNLSRSDTDASGAFLRRLRRRHAIETGDGLLAGERGS